MVFSNLGDIKILSSSISTRLLLVEIFQEGKKECVKVPREVCEKVLTPSCRSVPRHECSSVPRQQCTSVPKEQCTTVPRKVCQTVPKQCNNAPRQECRYDNCPKTVFYSTANSTSLLNNCIDTVQVHAILNNAEIR